ncbi:MAG: heavy metal-associated domain-containing protein [Bacteroidota bacterium]|jgi:copper chaperone CopZ
MKRLMSLFIALLLILAVVSAQPQQKVKTSATKIDTTMINVPTIVCNSCISTITKALKKVDGVKSTKIDLKMKIATVTYASTKTSLSKIEKAIAKAGYDANNTKRDPAAYEKLDACCKADAKE